MLFIASFNHQFFFYFQSEHIQIFPIAVASTFVTLSWNTSASLSTGRGYILRVRLAQNPNLGAENNGRFPQRSNLESGSGGAEVLNAVLKQYDDIDVGLKMNSYTVNGLSPGTAIIVLHVSQQASPKKNDAWTEFHTLHL